MKNLYQSQIFNNNFKRSKKNKEKDFLPKWIALAVLTLQGLGSEKQDKILGYLEPPIWLQFCVKFIAG